MQRFLWMLGLMFFAHLVSGFGQKIDILLTRGHIIDHKNNINTTMDVAIVAGKIFKVAPHIPSDNAQKVIDVTGMYVSPGLIDLHTHVFVGSGTGFADGSSSVKPDDFSFRSGVTTVVDAGTSGWKNFPIFKEQVIDRSRTRVLAFLNIFSSGMIGSPTEENMDDLDPRIAADLVEKYPEIIGIKIGHYRGTDWLAFDTALAAAELSNTPLLVECHLPGFSLKDQLGRMRRGDIITHTFENVSERMPVVDEQGKVRPFVREAQDKGILFDVGHGGAGFWFNQAVPAVAQGFLPDAFGTDMHHNSVNSGMKDMLNVMSKFLNMGMSMNEIILRATWKAARSIQREDLGNLDENAVADITVLRIREGDFGFIDAGGDKLEGNLKLEAELTIREGKVVWDLNGIAAKKWTTAE